MRVDRWLDFGVCERVEKLGIAVDNVCIRVDKRWRSVGVNPHPRSNSHQKLWVKIFLFISLFKNA